MYRLTCWLGVAPRARHVARTWHNRPDGLFVPKPPSDASCQSGGTPDLG
jgi:hypothetical protein